MLVFNQELCHLEVQWCYREDAMHITQDHLLPVSLVSKVNSLVKYLIYSLNSQS